MNPRTIVAIVVAVVLALGSGFATANFLSGSGADDDVHTMQNGQTMSGMTDTTP